MRQYSDRRKIKEVVVIRGTLFFYAPSREVFATVRNLPYIYNILRYPGSKHPTPISQSEYERLRLFVEGASEEVSYEPLCQAYPLGAEVYVFRGPLKGNIVRVVQEADKRAKIGIDIQLLGTLCTLVDTSDLMPLEQWEKMNR